MTSGLVNNNAILGFHDNWLYSSSCLYYAEIFATEYEISTLQ